MSEQNDAPGTEEQPTIVTETPETSEASETKAAPSQAASSMPTIDAPSEAAPAKDTAGGARRRPGRAISAGLLVLILGFGGGIAGSWAADEWLGDDNDSGTAGVTAGYQPSNDDVNVATPTPNEDGTLTPREIYQAVAPGVVHIDARTVKTSTNFFGFSEEQESRGTGSGFVIDEDGHIVTNAHVIEDASELTVGFGTDGRPVPAKLVGMDRSSDIAVIKIDPKAEELEGKQLTIVPFGDSSKVQVGDPVLAIGNPFGLDRTLTTGVVSALQREIPALNDFSISDVIQTDAAVNPGNSGGPLLDGAGNVIGVNSQIQSRGGDFAGVAFAVPSSRVQSVAKQLIEDGEVQYAWLGVAGGELTPELVKELDLEIKEGVLLGTVTEGSPAAKAGLRGTREERTLTGQSIRRLAGDVIIEFDGEQVTEMRALGAIVDQKRPGDKVEATYVRDGKEKTVTITLGERPDDLNEGSSTEGD